MTLDLTTLEASLKRDEELAAKATPGPWEVQDGCSWRRIGTTWESPRGSRDGNVLCPYNARSDGHPDLTAGRGEDTQANLTFIAHARTALLDRVRDCRILVAELNDARARASTIECRLADRLDAKQIALDEAFAVIERQRAFLAEAVRALEQYGEHQVGCEAKRSYHRACTCGYSAALSSLQPRKDTP